MVSPMKHVALLVLPCEMKSCAHTEKGPQQAAWMGARLRRAGLVLGGFHVLRTGQWRWS